MTEQGWATGEASGRIDFLGGVADYSGAWVLQIPIRAKTRVQVRPSSVASFKSQQEGQLTLQEDLWNAFRSSSAQDLASARNFLEQANVPSWVRYLLGCVAVLLHHHKWPSDLNQPLEFRVRSNVPLGMGVSSSAAIEVATLRALTRVAQLSWSGTELARLAQQAENEIVGAPCGLMDQLTAAHGKHRNLLPILCRPDLLDAPIRLPTGVAIVGWPSGVKHSVGAAHYSTARCGAFMAKKLIENKLQTRLQFLSELTPSQFANVSPSLPRVMQGKEFALEYKTHDDPLTGFTAASDSVTFDRTYPIRPAARFPIEESHRVQIAKSLFHELHRIGRSEAVGRQALPPHPALPSYRQELLTLLGEFLFQSHEGYSRMGLGCPETDAMVATVRELGPDEGFYGARISGGGSGGTVVVLLEESALPKLEQLRLKLATPHPLIQA
jgi:galactokinase